MSARPSPANDSVDVRAERPEDAIAVERLIGEAFGPGRFVKSAERLREANRPDLGLSFVAWDGDKPAGCVRQWPIRIGAAPAILLGPFAVDAHYRGRGIGAALVEAACEAAAEAGHRIVLLVGDTPFFQRLGFEPAPADKVLLPGPVDRRRLLWRALAPGALEGVEGPVRA